MAFKPSGRKSCSDLCWKWRFGLDGDKPRIRIVRSEVVEDALLNEMERPGTHTAPSVPGVVWDLKEAQAHETSKLQSCDLSSYLA
jgi:hypothetical protein